MRALAPKTVLLLALILPTGCKSLTPQERTWLEEGLRSYQRQNYDRAVQRLSSVINSGQDPTGVARALYVRGMSYALIGRRSLAYADLRRCVGLDANVKATWQAFAVLGTLNFEDEQWDAAGKAYGEAVSRMPSTPPIGTFYFRLGQCYERTGRWVESRAVFRRITERYRYSELADDARRRLELNAAHFSVQCGAFGKESNAENLKRELEQKGFSPFVRREPRGSSTLHFVLVGRHAKYADARRELAGVLQEVPGAMIWP